MSKKPTQQHSAEWVEWHSYKKGFVCGIYFRPTEKVYTCVLSDLEDINFKSVESCREWIDAKMRGE